MPLLTVKMTDAEHNALKAVAASHGKSMAQLIKDWTANDQGPRDPTHRACDETRQRLEAQLAVYTSGIATPAPAKQVATPAMPVVAQLDIAGVAPKRGLSEIMRSAGVEPVPSPDVVHELPEKPLTKAEIMRRLAPAPDDDCQTCRHAWHNDEDGCREPLDRRRRCGCKLYRSAADVLAALGVDPSEDPF